MFGRADLGATSRPVGGRMITRALTSDRASFIHGHDLVVDGGAILGGTTVFC